MDNNSKGYGSIEELGIAAAQGDPDALAKMQDLAQAVKVLDAVGNNSQPYKQLKDNINAALRMSEIPHLQELQKTLAEFGNEIATWQAEHEEALETLQDEEKAQAFLETITVDDLNAVLDKSTVKVVAPLLGSDLSDGKWIDILDNMELGEAVALYEYATANKDPQEYRTRSKAGEVVDVPEQLALFSSKPYKFALTYYSKYQGQNAYLLLLKDAKELKPAKNGTLTVKGLPITSEEIKKRTEEEISKLDTGFLNVPLSIISNDFRKTGKARETYTVKVSELASKIRNASNIGNNTINSLVANFTQYENLVGVLQKGNKASYYRVMLFNGYNAEKDTIIFSSPFITEVLKQAYESSIRLDGKTKKPKKQLPNGLYDTKAYLSTAASLSLKRERNKRAVRIVEIIIVLIEEAGRNAAQISAGKILEYMPDFAQELESTKLDSNKNLKLKRAFKRAFEILNEEPDKVTGRTRAGLKEKYNNIQMPTVFDLPTMATLDKVYIFRHDGKVKEGSEKPTA